MEEVILAGLVGDVEYARDVVPHLVPDYFKSPQNRLVFEMIRDFYEVRDKSPTKTELTVEIEQCVGSHPDDMVRDARAAAQGLWAAERNDPEWMLSKTEVFVKDRAVELALSKCLSVVAGEDKKTPRESIPDIMLEALGISFDKRIGHHYADDAEARWNFYNSDVERFPFHLEMLNAITNGGIPRKTLTVPVAGTNVGKSAFLCDMAANGLRAGKNVLYVSFEMSEEQIAHRIDANLMKTPMDSVPRMDKETFLGRVESVMTRTEGQLVIREYPNKSAGALHIRKLVRDLKTIRRFVPDIIMIDYLNICGATKVRTDASLYEYSKAVAEELRALAQELDVPVVAPTQTNRCLDLDTVVEVENKGFIRFGDVLPGDRISSSNGMNTVVEVFPVEESPVYEIELEDGTVVTCTENHMWPTETGLKTIEQGLTVGDYLFTAE